MFVGCSGGDAVDTDVETDADADADADADSDSDSDTDTDACEGSEGLELTADIADGPMSTQALLTVTSNEPTTVAALCVSDEDETEAHLVEGTTASTSHELRLMGLISDTPYTCTVAATCPTSAEPVTLSYETRRSPVSVPPVTVTIDEDLGMTGSYTLAIWGQSGSPNNYLVVWSADGQMRWLMRLPEGSTLGVEALFDEGTTQVLWGGGLLPSGAPTLTDLWDGELYKAALPEWDGDIWSHDTKRLPDGDILSMLYTDDFIGDHHWTGFGIRIHDPVTDTISFEFDSQRYVDEGILAEPGVNNDDPYHANWTGQQMTPRGPEVYVSLCTAQRILAIDQDNGDLLWDLGLGKGWTVREADGSALPETELPSCQHGLTVDGDLFYVYDNGRNRRESRAVVWRIDGVNRIATREWWWTRDGWYEPVVGNFDVLSPDRYLITDGSTELGEDKNELVEVDVATKQIASIWRVEGIGGRVYRSERYDGCRLFSNTKYCSALMDRRSELQPLFSR